ncbi:hypothetical protein EDB81DRAFT_3042 [Dactylonectria macrodidyma]|uniref:Uncharacterized protein n=1 Tax=Dactylonectria macrodidyma TaxID=307937 RepID=A0A9P9FTM3_9HYPO|nr:hypothetical protein EDB81DRAFT_3042 [Dactylonectria macrodidyma]
MAEQQDESTNPHHAGSDASFVSLRPETSKSIDTMSLKIFKNMKWAEWDRCTTNTYRYHDKDSEPPEFSADDAWLHYAALANPKAAYEFTRVAVIMRSLQGKYNKTGEVSKWTLPRNPLVYIEEYQFYIEDRWMNMLRDWNSEILQPSVGGDPKRCSLEWKKLHSARIEMQSRLEKLDGCLKDNSPHQVPKIDPAPAWRAIHTLLPQLEGLDSSISECLEDMRILWEERKSVLGQGEAPNELRRRRRQRSPIPIVAENNGESTINSIGQESLRKPRSSKIFPWLELHLLRLFKTLASHVLLMSPRKRLLRSMVKQSTLWTVSLTLAAVSGIFIGIAVSKHRAAVCRSTPDTLLSDDGFWTLLSQLVLNSLTIYCSVIPLLRDGDLSVRKAYFFGTAGISVAMSGLALVLYGFSWEVSTLFSYVASVAALMTGVQLAGGIADTRNLPQNIN